MSHNALSIFTQSFFPAAVLWIAYRIYFFFFPACKGRTCCSCGNLIPFQMYSINLHFMIQCSDFFHAFPAREFHIPNPPIPKSDGIYQLQIFSDVGPVDTFPVLQEEQKLCTVLSPLTSVDWSSPPSLPRLMKIDLFCLDFRSTFRLRDFSLLCWLYISFECVPIIKEKATQPGPRQQVKVDTNVIETGYWYSPCSLPAHLGGELFLRCTLIMVVFLS